VAPGQSQSGARRRQTHRGSGDPLSWQEVQIFLDKGFKTYLVMRRFYTVKIFTGIRDSELIGSKWTDIDWTSDPPMVVINRSFTKLDREHLTKTPGSARALISGGRRHFGR
jgi:integrase